MIRIVCQESEIEALNLPQLSEIYNEHDESGASNEEDEASDEENQGFRAMTDRIEQRLLKHKRLEAWRRNREQVLWKYNHKSYIAMPVSSKQSLAVLSIIIAFRRLCFFSKLHT